MLVDSHCHLDFDEFRDRIRSFLLALERGSQRLHTPPDDVFLATRARRSSSADLSTGGLLRSAKYASYSA